MLFGSDRSECKSRLQSKPECGLGKSHHLSVPQFPYLKKQCFPYPPKAGSEQSKPMTYMGSDGHSLALQKEAREVLNLLMIPRGMLSIDETAETLGSLCTGWIESAGEGCLSDPPSLSPIFPHWVHLVSKPRSPGRPWTHTNTNAVCVTLLWQRMHSSLSKLMLHVWQAC